MEYKVLKIERWNLIKGVGKVAEQKNAQEQDLNQLRNVRREKLADLQENGKNPFLITKYDVTLITVWKLKK